MRFQEHDYLIIKGEGKKKHLVKASAVSKGNEEGYSLTVTEEPEGFEVTQENLLAVLGPVLPTGNAFGVRLEAFYRSAKSSLGEVYWYFKPEKEARKAMNKAIESVYERLDEMRLTSFLPVRVEVRPARGKYAGKYSYNTEKGDTLLMMPKSDLWRNDLEYVVAHECGHGVWFRLMSDKMKGSWVNLYHQSVKITDVTEEDLERVLSYFEADEANGGFISTVRGQLEESDVPIYDEIIDYIYVTHHLDLESLDLMVQGGYEIKHMFPTVAALSEVEPLVTEYGSLNCKEFWAEAFAMRCVGIKLPKRVDSLMDRTLEHLKKRA